MADCLFRPPDVLSLPRSTKVAGVKVPSGSLAALVARDGSPGVSSTVAAVTPGPVLDMAELAHAQKGCQETQGLRAKLAAQDMLISSHKIWCDNSLGVLRPLVPVSMWRLVFNSMYSLAHPGIRATRHMLTSRFVWTSCSLDVGVGSASSVHVPRFSLRREQLWTPSRCLYTSSPTCTWTWWVPGHVLQRATLTC